MADVIRLYTRLGVVLNRIPTATWKIVSLQLEAFDHQKFTYNSWNVWENNNSPMEGRLDGSLRSSLCAIKHKPASSNHSDGTKSGLVTRIFSYNAAVSSSSSTHGDRPVIISQMMTPRDHISEGRP